MRVLIANSLLTGGGVDSHTLTLSKALAQAGVEVTLAAPPGARWMGKALQIDKLRIAPVDSGRLGWPLALRSVARREGIDIIHAHHGRDYWLAVAGARLAGSRVRAVITRHLMTPLRPSTRRHIGRFAQVIAVSAAVARMLAGQDPQHPLPLHVVRCGVDTGEFVPSPAAYQALRQKLDLPETAFVFGMVGNVHPPEGKGHFFFAEAAAAMHTADTFFLCIGSGERLEDLKGRVAALGVAAQFRFVLFTDELRQMMQGFDALVHPAVGSEALGLVILEALSCGEPVVASRLDGIPETFSDGEQGFLVPPRDSAALAAAMSRLTSDRAGAAQMGRRGREWIEENFSLRRLADETIAVYEQALLHG